MVTENRAFLSHRGRALYLNIGFDFTFEEWREWWIENLGPDWLQKRGPRSGQFVMARFGDTGPYHPMNVKCITKAQNTIERVKLRGERHQDSRLTREQVQEARRLYQPYSLEFGAKALARRYGICAGSMVKCLSGDSWKHVSGAVSRPGSRPKINAEIAAEIRRSCAGGERQHVIARKFGLTQSAVSDVLTGKTWKSHA